MKMAHIVMKHRRTTLERAEKFISDHYFKDVNLKGRLYPRSHPVSSITHWAAPKHKYSTYEEAVNQVYCAVKVGQQFGPTWATHWFHVVVDVPADWVGCEARLKWKSGSEALVWVDGQPRQGLCSEYDRLDFPLTECVTPDQLKFSVYVEMACNGMFGAGDNGMIAPPDLKRQFTLSCCEVVVFDRRVYNLIRDVEMLYDLAKHLPEGSERGYQALYTVNDVINACDVNSTDSFEKCHEIANRFLKQKNGESQHTIYAMGHAHIDTAWLWPYSETIRKCARSWSCTIRLMEKYPEFTFTCSQAQQFQWVKQQYPGLYDEIKEFVSQGRFIPVGGTWVEMDGLIPSGEAFIRQFLFGQRYFQSEFGITCKEFWLPDTFGYSGQLPQIMNHCGITRFLTQKMSWSLVNKFPNHTFWWEGIDSTKILTHFPPGDSYAMKGKVEENHTFWWEGIDSTKILTHFPPGDSYEMKGKVEEVLRTVKNFQDKGRSDKTAFLFGFGDGGNGPSEDMLERLQRMKDVDGLPKVKMSTPDALFSKIEEEDGDKLCHWAGELYLELHNGTYTTHAKVKKMNRKCEFMLHDVEFLSCVAVVTQNVKTGARQFCYPTEELNRLWKLLLLNQFHDVLPGTSIGMVYTDAHKYYNDIMASGNKMIQRASEYSAIEAGFNAEDNTKRSIADGAKTGHVIWNTQSFDRSEVVCVASSQEENTEGPAKKKQKVDTLPVSAQKDSHGNSLYYVNVPSYGLNPVSSAKILEPVHIETVDRVGIELRNEHLEATIDKLGRVTKLIVKGSQRNAISHDCPANQFTMHDDIPLYWDAWDVMDYHMETRKPVETVLSEPKIVESGPLRASVKFSLQISEKSTLEQTISLDTGSTYLKFQTQVVWNENRKFLKVEFPTSIHTREATYDIQCGYMKRPNHFNTSWDSARFEVCGHKWSDLSEYGFGVAVLNDCKYGHSAVDNVLRMSLLRSPKAPDNTADMETHTFTYALMPHIGSLQSAGVIKEAYCLNNPLLVQPQVGGTAELASSGTSYFSVGSQQVVLETVKKAEDRDNELVLRLYESFGGECDSYLSTAVPFKSVHLCNGLEEINTDSKDLTVEANKIHFTIKPFQIMSLRLVLY